jgi:hypothetical protein
LFILFEKVAWLKSTGIFLETKQQIRTFMDATYKFRLQQIEDTLFNPTLIMEEYPKFKDFEQGELVC